MVGLLPDQSGHPEPDQETKLLAGPGAQLPKLEAPVRGPAQPSDPEVLLKLDPGTFIRKEAAQKLFDLIPERRQVLLLRLGPAFREGFVEAFRCLRLPLPAIYLSLGGLRLLPRSLQPFVKPPQVRAGKPPSQFA